MYWISTHPEFKNSTGDPIQGQPDTISSTSSARGTPGSASPAPSSHNASSSPPSTNMSKVHSPKKIFHDFMSIAATNTNAPKDHGDGAHHSRAVHDHRLA